MLPESLSAVPLAEAALVEAVLVPVAPIVTVMAVVVMIASAHVSDADRRSPVRHVTIAGIAIAVGVRGMRRIIQYVAYTQLNGGNKGYDGATNRNASPIISARSPGTRSHRVVSGHPLSPGTT
jgi:hypothetical protein